MYPLRLAHEPSRANLPGAQAMIITFHQTMIITFDKMHQIGSVCMFPCEQCADDPTQPELSALTGADGYERIPFQPLLIVREATRQEWEVWCRSQATPFQPFINNPSNYFYEVSTD